MKSVMHSRLFIIITTVLIFSLSSCSTVKDFDGSFDSWILNYYRYSMGGSTETNIASDKRIFFLEDDYSESPPRSWEAFITDEELQNIIDLIEAADITSRENQGPCEPDLMDSGTYRFVFTGDGEEINRFQIVDDCDLPQSVQNLIDAIGELVMRYNPYG